MFGLCKYQDMFGKPNMGIHRHRFLKIALADVGQVILAALVISYVFKYPFLYVLLFLFVFGIVCHELFCVKTTVYKWIHQLPS